MDRQGRRRKRTTEKQQRMEITVHWEAGPRTPAWEELWRRIFQDIPLIKGEPSEETSKPQG